MKEFIIIVRLPSSSFGTLRDQPTVKCFEPRLLKLKLVQLCINFGKIVISVRRSSGKSFIGICQDELGKKNQKFKDEHGIEEWAPIDIGV